MKLTATRFWLLVGASAFVGFAGACSSDNASSPDSSGGAGETSGNGGKASGGKGGQASAGKGGKGSGGASEAGAGGDQAGSAGDLAGGAPDMAGGAAGQAGAAGEHSVATQTCSGDMDCSPGICNASHCAAAECSATDDCTSTKACKSGRCLACTTVPVLFKYTPPGAAPTAVYLEGEFNGWPQTPDPNYKLTAQGNGDFTLSVPLAPGSYAYQFVVDGTWTLDAGNPRTGDNGFGGLNSVDLVSCHGVVPPECVNNDQACTGGKICKSFACVAPECVINQDCNSASLMCGAGHCVQKTCNHTFTYNGAASTVVVAGDWTDWQNHPVSLTQSPANVWTGTFPLVPGAHEYKFILDGSNWIQDPSAPVAPTDDNSYIADACASGGSGG